MLAVSKNAVLQVGPCDNIPVSRAFGGLGIIPPTYLGILPLHAAQLADEDDLSLHSNPGRSRRQAMSGSHHGRSFCIDLAGEMARVD